jgi:hypothetical protein
LPAEPPVAPLFIPDAPEPPVLVPETPLVPEVPPRDVPRFFELPEQAPAGIEATTATTTR